MGSHGSKQSRAAALCTTLPRCALCRVVGTIYLSLCLQDSPQCADGLNSSPYQQCSWPAAAVVAAMQVVRHGGWQALFAGLEASLIGTTISQGIYFYL